MVNHSHTLPWQELRHTEAEIPWTAIDTFAHTLTNNPAIADRLMELYDEAIDMPPEEPTYVDLHVPAIFALAAPKCSTNQRRRIGQFLLDKLSEAGQRDEELLMDVLQAACGSLGPSILPDVLAAIEGEPNRRGAWFHLWGLTELAAETDNPELREPTIRACLDLLGRVVHSEIDPGCAMPSIWTLVQLKHQPALGILKKILKRDLTGFKADYEDAVSILEGRATSDILPQPIWRQPVRQWLNSQWRAVRECYAQQQTDQELPTPDPEIERIAGLVERFTASSQYAQLAPDIRAMVPYVARKLLQLAWESAGCRAKQIDAPVLKTIHLELFPAHLLGDEQLFGAVVPITKALLQWLQAEETLDDAQTPIEAMDQWADQIVPECMDERNWGIVKMLLGCAVQDGVDIDDKDQLKRYIKDFSTFVTSHLRADFERQLHMPLDEKPPIPIEELSHRIGRNEPCPCGSGRKYKKCCGRSTNAHAET